MSNSLLSKHTPLNTGAIPASAEELSQGYEKLFQQYSRLKAQHAILKKAVIKEQATNVTLQGNVKEKEKELRKLQERLDLLSFHNKRLTKRIQAVQENDQKGNRFSLLGGSTKKELEKSTQALDAANFDLECKIQENERLHEELTEREVEYTNTIQNLSKQVENLENQVQGLILDNTRLLEPEHFTIPRESCDVDQLESDLARTMQLLEEQDKNHHHVMEIRSLRDILLDNSKSLNDLLDDYSLKKLEDQRDEGSQEKQTTLPNEIIEKLRGSHKTWREELANVNAELQDKKRELSDLLGKQGQTGSFEVQMKQFKDEHEEEMARLNKEHSEKMDQINAQYENQWRDQLLVIENKTKQIQELVIMNETLEKENTRLEQEIGQINKSRESKVDQETQTKHETIGTEEKHVYPKEDFVYTCVDAVPTEQEVEEENEENMAMLKIFYEQKIRDMTKKIQHTDSKALRFADMYKASKEKMNSKEKDKQLMMSEIERLNKEVKHVQDLLTTTESNYQKQIDTMTEYITSIEEQRRSS